METLIDLDDSTNARLKWVEQFWDELGETLPVIDQEDVDEFHPNPDWLGDLLEAFIIQDTSHTMDERSNALAYGMEQMRQHRADVIDQFVEHNSELKQTITRRLGDVCARINMTEAELLDLYLCGRPSSSKTISLDRSVDWAYLDKTQYRITMRQTLRCHWVALAEHIARWTVNQAQEKLDLPSGTTPVQRKGFP